MFLSVVFSVHTELETGLKLESNYLYKTHREQDLDHTAEINKQMFLCLGPNILNVKKDQWNQQEFSGTFVCSTFLFSA